PEREQCERTIETRVGIFIERERHLELDKRAFEVITMEAIDTGVEVQRRDVGFNQGRTGLAICREGRRPGAKRPSPLASAPRTQKKPKLLQVLLGVGAPGCVSDGTTATPHPVAGDQ